MTTATNITRAASFLMLVAAIVILITALLRYLILDQVAGSDIALGVSISIMAVSILVSTRQ